MSLPKDWLRQNTVDILNYLPAFLSKDKEFKDICDDCSEEHETCRLALQDIFEQFFIESATWGLDFWEELLDLSHNAGDSYDTRRSQILLKLNGSVTSTLDYMLKLAKRYFSGTASVELVEQNEQYAFKIVSDMVSTDANALINAINTYKPAHLAFVIEYMSYGSMNTYSGGVLQEARTITVLPELGIDLDGSKTICYAGVIQIATSTVIDTKKY